MRWNTKYYSRELYLFKLGGPISTRLDVQQIAGLLELPPLIEWMDLSCTYTEFCIINGEDRTQIELWLMGQRSSYRPVSMLHNVARKQLSPHTAFPMLGLTFDPTMPQHRAIDGGDTIQPAQDQFPVWYFFCDDLQDPNTHRRKLLLQKTPVPVPARVEGAVIRPTRFGLGREWQLLDAAQAMCVEGCVYSVKNVREENKLRSHYGYHFEVVRCNITLDNGDKVVGLTFRVAASKRFLEIPVEEDSLETDEDTLESDEYPLESDDLRDPRQ